MSTNINTTIPNTTIKIAMTVYSAIRKAHAPLAILSPISLIWSMDYDVTSYCVSESELVIGINLTRKTIKALNAAHSSAKATAK